MVSGFIDSLDEEPPDTQGDTHRDTQEIHGDERSSGADSPALAALAVRQNVARWVEKDARAADKVIKREVKSVRKELGALAAEAQQMRTSAKQLENERSSGRPESRSKGVDR